MARRDSFDNRIDEVSRWPATDDITPFSIEDGLGAAISWDLPPAYCCIIRSTDRVTGKVTEKSYRNAKAAHKHLLKLWMNDALKVTILTDEAIHQPANEHHETN